MPSGITRFTHENVTYTNLSVNEIRDSNGNTIIGSTGGTITSLARIDAQVKALSEAITILPALTRISGGAGDGHMVKVVATETVVFGLNSGVLCKRLNRYPRISSINITFAGINATNYCDKQEVIIYNSDGTENSRETTDTDRKTAGTYPLVVTSTVNIAYPFLLSLDFVYLNAPMYVTLISVILDSDY